MYKVILFAGTTEGRLLAEFLGREGVQTLVCVATEYGAALLPESEALTVSHERLNQEEMRGLFRTHLPEVVIDATHPYASEVTANICKAAEESGADYLRLLRKESGEGDGTSPRIYVDSVREAAAWLAAKEGKILVTTGSKELDAFTALPEYKERVIARVLSTAEVAARCSALGFAGKNLICMQGPFSQQLNEAMLRQYGCKYLVTKASGSAGGYEEKLAAAAACGVTAVIIGRPEKEEGLSYYDCKEELCRRLGLQPARNIALVGIGMGEESTMTGEAAAAIRNAEVVIGAQRMVEAAALFGQKTAALYDSQKIIDWLMDHPAYERAAVVLSGDIGFYSGAKKLSGLLTRQGWQVEYISGISSLSYFMGKIGLPWDDAVVVSSHGRKAELIPLIRDHEKVFSILGGRRDVAELAGRLLDMGLEQVKLYVGENLSYDNERIFCGSPEELADYEGDALSVVTVVNPAAERTRINPLTSRADREFLRDKTPMTKEEVRTVSLSKLRLTKDAVCYDVGAGTGSVAVEMAVKASGGHVYAIERKPDAAALLQRNRRKFRADNLTVIEGLAPEALADLPAPTHVFIGGSSGNMESIVAVVMKKNPDVRVVINCIAVESAAEAVRCARRFAAAHPGAEAPEILQLSVTRAKTVGGYTMMHGENPITIVAFGGGSGPESDRGFGGKSGEDFSGEGAVEADKEAAIEAAESISEKNDKEVGR